jgi:hypothetical protein
VFSWLVLGRRRSRHREILFNRAAETGAIPPISEPLFLASEPASLFTPMGHAIVSRVAALTALNGGTQAPVVFPRLRSAVQRGRFRPAKPAGPCDTHAW